MKTNFEETIKGMTEFLKNEAKTETIIGKEFKLGNFNCVPVMAVGMGVGGGEGVGNTSKKAEGEGGVGGAGIGLSPIGFLVSRNSDIRFITVHGSSALNTAFEKLPELLTMYFENTKPKKEKLATV
ncbi:MAG: GerW family sporulation protein [Bacteroidetes bacterium]|nr:GerW family sporulation protein [Bacteroidota bacterium]